MYFLLLPTATGSLSLQTHPGRAPGALHLTGKHPTFFLHSRTSGYAQHKRFNNRADLQNSLPEGSKAFRYNLTVPYRLDSKSSGSHAPESSDPSAEDHACSVHAICPHPFTHGCNCQALIQCTSQTLNMIKNLPGTWHLCLFLEIRW